MQPVLRRRWRERLRGPLDGDVGGGGGDELALPPPGRMYFLV